MKKFSILLMLAVCSLFVNAQETMNKPSQKRTHECYLVKDGVVHHCVEGTSKPISENVTLEDGTVITPDGSVTKKDGASQKISDGQCISMEGQVGDCNRMKHSRGQRGSEKAAPPADQVK